MHKQGTKEWCGKGRQELTELVLGEPAPAQHMEQKHGKTESPGKTGDVEDLQGILALLGKWKWRRKLLLSSLRAFQIEICL